MRLMTFVVAVSLVGTGSITPRSAALSTPEPPAGSTSAAAWADPSAVLVPGAAGTIPLGTSSWQRVPDELAFGSPVPDQLLTDVAIGTHGLLAVGGTSVEGPAVWSSADGIEWTRAPDSPTLDGVVPAAVASDGDRAVLVGAHGAAISTDGTSWRGTRDAFGKGEPRDIVALGSLFVAVGRDYPAATAWPSGPSVGAAWTSIDGVSWSIVTGFPGGETGADAWVNSITRGGPGLVAVGAINRGPRLPYDAAAWVSADGRAWTRAPDAPDLRGAWMVDVAAGAAGLVAVGAVGPGAQPTAAVWRSADGLTWTRGPASEALAVGPMSGVAAGGNGYIAIGDNLHVPADTATWTSRDGATWTQVPPPPGAYGLTRVLVTEHGVIVLGWTMVPDRCGRNGTYSRAAIWIEPPVTLPAQRSAPPPAPLPVIPGAWAALPSMPVAHSAGAATVGRDGRLYVFGGATDRNGRNIQLSAVQRYDPATRRWTMRAPIPGAAASRAAAVTGTDGRIWVFNGWGNLYAPYDPAANRWGAFARTPKGQTVATAVAGPGRTIFVVTTDSAHVYRLYALDPAGGRWTLRGSLDRSAVGGLAMGRDGQLYSVTNRLWRIDPATGRAQPLSRPPSPRGGAAVAVARDGRIWVVGGTGVCGPAASSEAYDPASDRWATGPALPVGRTEGVAAADGRGSIYSLGGLVRTATGTTTSGGLVSLVLPTAKPSSGGWRSAR